ncbi:hypothetical protein ACO0K9_15840 [Undibacterium sp. Ji50W]
MGELKKILVGEWQKGLQPGFISHSTWLYAGAFLLQAGVKAGIDT